MIMFPCLYCSERFNESMQGEEWIRCDACKEWAHMECAGPCSGDFICEFCME